MPKQKQKRLAVIDRELCNPKTCGYYLCQRVCPVNRAKKECITVFETGEKADKKPLIDEVLCIGCGICVHKCPTQAISVVNLPEKLDENPVHRYGRNGFSLFRLPMPKKDMVTALIGPNGVGKSTLMDVLSGNLKPNSGLVGKDEASATWNLIKKRFKGTEIQDYLDMLSESRVKASYKPQHVDLIPKMYKGTVREIIGKMAGKAGSAGKSGKARADDIVKRLDITEMLDKKISSLSGGELQLFAIAGAFLKDADFYFFDEPSSYLDVHERLKVAREIRGLTERAVVMVVEHDLAVADYLADNVHVLYGKPGVFGIVSVPYGVRVGINTFLEGYLKEENVRFRPEPIVFGKGAKEAMKNKLFTEFPAFSKSFGSSFSLKTEPGELHKGEIIGILGPNAIGKTTFIRMLTGELPPDGGHSDGWEMKSGNAQSTGMEGLSLSYKPQRLVLTKQQEMLMVRDFIKSASGKKIIGKGDKRVLRLLKLEKLLERTMKRLSGGEMQAAFIAASLIKDADIMLLDEPSAFLDVEQRLMAARLIRERAEGREIPCFVVDHDLQFIDAISDRVVVFDGEQGVKGRAGAPVGLKDGMNSFLKALGITFRKDPITWRPRANKPGSQKDVEQKEEGEYFYA
jgi:ATP-binding cassette subfamily E protein 1